MRALQHATPVATMRRLASAVGAVPEYRRGNLLYGQFAARVRRELGLSRPKYKIWVLATWPEPPIEEAGEFAFRLRPEVVEAVDRLNWITPGARVEGNLSASVIPEQRWPETLN